MVKKNRNMDDIRTISVEGDRDIGLRGDHEYTGVHMVNGKRLYTNRTYAIDGYHFPLTYLPSCGKVILVRQKYYDKFQKMIQERSRNNYKYNKTVADLVDKARRNGSAKSGSYEARWYQNENIFILSHYGTKIIQIDNGKIVKLGGYSQSDANAISTVLAKFGLPYKVTSNRDKASKAQGYKFIDGWYVIQR